jgi:hypothetical protein
MQLKINIETRIYFSTSQGRACERGGGGQKQVEEPFSLLDKFNFKAVFTPPVTLPHTRPAFFSVFYLVHSPQCGRYPIILSHKPVCITTVRSPYRASNG